MMYRRKGRFQARSRGMSDVSSILKRSFKKLRLDVSLWEHTIFKVWNDAVGERIASRAQPFRVIGSTLYVKVSSTPWMQELNFMKEGIRVKLNARLKGKEVKEIIFKLGRWDKRIIRGKSMRPPWMDVHLGKEDTDSLKEEFAPVKDPELRETLFRIRASEKKLRIFKKRPSRQK